MGAAFPRRVPAFLRDFVHDLLACRIFLVDADGRAPLRVFGRNYHETDVSEHL